MKHEVRIKLKDEKCFPVKAHEIDMGYDLKSNESYDLSPGEVKVIDTGVAIALPVEEDYIWEGQIRPRSGLSLKTKLRISNSPGTIDANYRNYIGIICENTGDESIKIIKGDRIAQLVISRSPKVEFKIVDELDDTDRGLKGFGSSGK